MDKEKEIEFRGKKPGEEVIFILRKHPWTLFVPGLIFVITLLVVITAFVLWKASWITSIIFFAGIAVVWSTSIKALFVWWNSTYVLTNERVIAVEQKGWVSRAVREANLEDVLMINHIIEGFFPTMFNYGTVYLHASGATENELVLYNLYDPYGVQQVIFKTKKEIGKRNFDKKEAIGDDNEEGDKEKVILR